MIVSYFHQYHWFLQIIWIPVEALWDTNLNSTLLFLEKYIIFRKLPAWQAHSALSEFSLKTSTSSHFQCIPLSLKTWRFISFLGQRFYWETWQQMYSRYYYFVMVTCKLKVNTAWIFLDVCIGAKQFRPPGAELPRHGSINYPWASLVQISLSSI